MGRGAGSRRGRFIGGDERGWTREMGALQRGHFRARWRPGSAEKVGVVTWGGRRPKDDMSAGVGGSFPGCSAVFCMLNLKVRV